MDNYIVKGKVLKLANGSVIEFDFPIKKTVVVNNIIIIIVDPPFDTIYNHNFFGITLTGDFLWRIGHVELYYWGSDNCPYVGAIVNDDDELVLFNWCDTAVIVNPQNGEVIRTYQTK